LAEKGNSDTLEQITQIFIIFAKSEFIMKKMLLFVVFLVVFSLFVSAVDLEVETFSRGNVIIAEVGNPGNFDFVITNNLDHSESVEIFSLTGLSFSPRGNFDLKEGRNFLDVQAYLSEDLLRNRGLVKLEYQIKGQSAGIIKDNLVFRVVSFEDVFNVEANDLKFGDSNALVRIRNIQNTPLKDVKVKFNSVFFDFEAKGDFEPFEEKEFTVPVNKDIGNVVAGHYFFDAGIEIEGVKTKVSGVMNYLEKENIISDSTSNGFIVREISMIRKNEGNKRSSVEIEVSKNVITRLFTSFSEEPDKTERNGLFVHYFWDREINPGEGAEIKVTTNYTFPFILLILIVLIGVFVRAYTMTNIVANKKVNFVKTKGGEFALRVKIRIKARKAVSNVQVIDSLPRMTKLYEKFGKEPDKIDEKTRKLYWNLGSLNAGEERSISYIIYSKVRAVGRFELSSSRVVYKREGTEEEVYSNRAYFVSETIEED